MKEEIEKIVAKYLRKVAKISGEQRISPYQDLMTRELLELVEEIIGKKRLEKTINKQKN